MFGGIGCFKDGIMFGMIDSKDRFRLRVDEPNQAKFEAYNMEAFYSGKKKKGMPYWEVPAEILEDKTTLAEWAGESFTIAENTKRKK
jgi:DNA transformation protein